MFVGKESGKKLERERERERAGKKLLATKCRAGYPRPSVYTVNIISSHLIS